MTDFVGGSATPRDMRNQSDIQEHFRKKGYRVEAQAIFHPCGLLVGLLEDRGEMGHIFTTYRDPGYPEPVELAIKDAQEYSLPIVKDIEGRAY